MSYGSAGAAAVQDRLRVEYAPTDRASCKSCGTGMPKGSVKLGEKVRSPWHDGWDIKFCKVKCAIHKANGMPHEISHLQKLKWKDQVEIVEMMGKTVEKGAATEALKARSDQLYALIEVLQGMTKANIKELCEANGSQVHGDKAAPPDMAYTAADGLLYGKLGECPWCKSEALQQEGNLVRCMGYLTAGTRCTYSICEGPLFGSAPCTKVGALPERGAPWLLTDAAEKSLKKAKYNLPTAGSGAAGGSGGAAGSGAGGAAADDDDAESEEEEEAAEGTAMVGLTFASVGSTDPPAAALQQLVAAHGGAWVSGGIGDGGGITHLISTAAEARKPKGKKAAK